MHPLRWEIHIFLLRVLSYLSDYFGHFDNLFTQNFNVSHTYDLLSPCFTGDMGFDGGANIIQDAHMDDTLYVKNPDSSALLLDDPTAQGSKGHEKPMDIDFNAQGAGDGFGDGMDDFGRQWNL